MDASMLWIQQKEREKVLTVAAIPIDLNSADIGAKNLPKKRLRGLQYMLRMVDAVGDRVGEQEFLEIEEQRKMKQGMKKFGEKQRSTDRAFDAASYDQQSGKHPN